MRALRPLLLPLLLASSLGAQTPVRVVGLLEPIPGPVLCAQRVAYHLACTDVYLNSNAVALGTFVGQVVAVEGLATGSGSCRVVDVRTVQAPAESLRWSGNPAPGGQVDFTLYGPGLSANLLFVGSGRAFLPVDLGFGTLLVAPPLYVVARVNSGGVATVSVPIPPSPYLSGHEVYLQSLHSSIGPIGPPYVGNCVCVRIL